MQFWIWVVLENPHEPKVHKIQLTTYVYDNVPPLRVQSLVLGNCKQCCYRKRHRKPKGSNMQFWVWMGLENPHERKAEKRNNDDFPPWHLRSCALGNCTQCWILQSFQCDMNILIGKPKTNNKLSFSNAFNTF